LGYRKNRKEVLLMKTFQNIIINKSQMLLRGKKIQLSKGVILLFALCILQFGCTSIKLKTVLIQNRSVGSGEAQVVQVYREGELLTTKSNMTLEEQDEIITDSVSTAVLTFPGGTEVIVAPNTHIKISSIFVYFGEVLVKARRFFAVETEFEIVGTEGTEFIVRVEPNVEVETIVLEGTVKIESKTQSWPPKRVTQFQRATIPWQQAPEITDMTQDEINGYIRWRNRIEQVVKGKKSKLLVSDVVGLSEQEAKNVLAGEQIAVGKIVKRITNTQPIGNVVAQKPVAGTEISRKTSVQLDVEAVPVEVPSLIGIDRTRAIDMLRQSGLTVGKEKKEITGDFRVDAIIRQDPQPGIIVPEDSSVNLWIEAESVLIPYVEGMPIEQAREILRNGRLRIKEKENVQGVAEVGTVLGQDPRADTRVPPNTEVKLSVEAGVRVPDVTGQRERDAINILQQYQLSAGRIERKITGRAQQDTVLDQDPRAGKVAKVNSGVKLIVEAESVTVPNVTGMSSQQAQNSLFSQGLRAEFREELKGTARIGTVLRQDPQAGTLVEPGKTIRAYVEAGVQVPNVVGTSVQQATSVLRSKGFTSVNPREDVRGQTSLNTVLSQNPQAGSAAKPDRTVTLYYEAGVRVPDGRNLNVSSAESRLRSAGFRTRIDFRETSQYREGTVMDQSPSANSAAKPNSTITLMVAKAPVCQLPRVIRLRLNEAKTILENAGFRLGRVRDISNPTYRIPEQDYRKYYVDQQNPRAGSSPCGSSVNLDVGYIVQ